MELDNKILLRCDCGNLSHIMELEIDSDCNLGYINIFLNREPDFFKRVLVGFKYIFGFKNSSDALYEFDSIVLTTKDLINLRTFMNKNLK